MKVINNTNTHTHPYMPALPHTPRPHLPGKGTEGWRRGGAAVGRQTRGTTGAWAGVPARPAESE